MRAQCPTPPLTTTKAQRGQELASDHTTEQGHLLNRRSCPGCFFLSLQVDTGLSVEHLGSPWSTWTFCGAPWISVEHLGSPWSTLTFCGAPGSQHLSVRQHLGPVCPVTVSEQSDRTLILCSWWPLGAPWLSHESPVQLYLWNTLPTQGSAAGSLRPRNHPSPWSFPYTSSYPTPVISVLIHCHTSEPLCLL